MPKFEEKWAKKIELIHFSNNIGLQITRQM